MLKSSMNQAPTNSATNRRIPDWLKDWDGSFPVEARGLSVTNQFAPGLAT
jgi:hypothetical protein